MGRIGATEIIIILVIVLLLFGGKKIPELMRGVGKGIREFNNAKANVEDEIRKGMDDDKKKARGLENQSQSSNWRAPLFSFVHAAFGFCLVVGHSPLRIRCGRELSD